MTPRYDSTTPSVSADASAIMMFEANKKSIGVAYLLWFLLGTLGAHRFYVRKTGSAIGQMLLLFIGWLTLIVGVGALLLIGLIIWVIVDAFLIPGWIRNLNSLLAMQMGYQNPSFQSPSLVPQERATDYSNVDRLIARQLEENAKARPTDVSLVQPPPRSAPSFGKRGRS